MNTGKKPSLKGSTSKVEPTFFTRIIITILTLSLFVTPLMAQKFKSDQLRYSRVRTAFSENQDSIRKLMNNHGITLSNVEVFLRVLKEEEKLQLFAKNRTDSAFKLIKSYDFCSNSGTLGPKRQQGDMQVPEGFYKIDRFNPYSLFYLSMGIDYPNNSDRRLSSASNLGGDIFLHGDCVTVGCVPITDRWIKELYAICVEAKNAGQKDIHVHFFPFEMSDSNFSDRLVNYPQFKDFWSNLKQGFDHFERAKTIPDIEIDQSGVYHFNSL